MTWQIPTLLAGIALLAPVVWRRPQVAIYVLVGAAATLENFPLGFPDSFTDTIGFFLNLNNTANLPISASPADLLMLVGIVAWLRSPVAGGTPRFPRSRLRRAYLVFMGVVLLAELWGLASGGNFNITLWELRPQVYGFILFLLASSLVRERRQVVWIAGIFLACTAFKAGVADFRYTVTLHGDLGGKEALLGHEDSYFLLMFLVAMLVAAIWVRQRRVVLPLLLASPLVTVAMLENQRRIAMLALWGAVAVVVAMAIRFEPSVRKMVAVFAVIGTLAFVGFVAAEWNVTDGLAGQAVRPVHTLFGQVDPRDLSSDMYRLAENADLRASYQTSPLIGTGFGLPMLLPFPLADISQQYPLWDYITHNSILWVAMRMGILGMATFWALIGMVLLEGMVVLRGHEDRFLRGVAAFALAAVAAELVMAYGDLQLEAYRNMIFFGVMVGLIDALPRVREATASVTDEAVQVVRAPVPRHWAAAVAVEATTGPPPESLRAHIPGS